jgi:D-alanyl-D-alanine carboxypeptidase
VQAKTGTILGTIALSGVAMTKHSGERLFSVIVNDRPLRFSALDTRRAVDNLAATAEGCWK